MKNRYDIVVIGSGIGGLVSAALLSGAGKKVLVAPQWIQRVSWDEAKVFVNLSRQAIQQSPEYTEQALLTREYETDLHRHYNRRDFG